MNRQTLDGLTVFCAAQRYRFDPAAWRLRSASDGKRQAYAAKYLAMTSWYVHEDALESIAEEIYPGITNRETLD